MDRTQQAVEGLEGLAKAFGVAYGSLTIHFTNGRFGYVESRSTIKQEGLQNILSA